MKLSEIAMAERIDLIDYVRPIDPVPNMIFVSIDESKGFWVEIEEGDQIGDSLLFAKQQYYKR